MEDNFNHRELEEHFRGHSREVLGQTPALGQAVAVRLGMLRS